MKVTQIYSIVNSATNAVLGETAVLEEDLSNIVSVGKAVFDSDNVDNYVKQLVNHIGKVVFVNRVYSGGVPSVLMDAWEYGSIMEKISTVLPDAQESDSWKLVDGVDYSPNTFHKPEVSVKFFNNKTTFEIPLSFTEMQVKESFSSATQLNGFISMLTTAVENSMTVKLDALIMRTIANMVGEVHFADNAVQKVDLLALYNVKYAQTLDASEALTDPDFIRFATYTMGLYSDRMAKVSTLFNVGGKERFSPKDLQKVVLLSDFSKASETYLLSQTENQERVVLPTHDSVPYWQGSGVGYDFEDVSKINVKTAGGEVVEFTGLIGIIFDRDSLGVSNLDRRVTTNYNPKGEFYTNFYKFDAGFFNDLDENAVIFYLGTEVTP